MGNAVEEVFNKLVSTVQPLSTEYYAKHLHLLAHLIFITNSEVKSISSLQIKTLKLREGKCLSPGHTASEDVSDSVRPHGLSPTRLLRPWDFPGKSTGVGCHWHIKKQS